jgi:dolichol-phosphate mannosyltransferase
LRAIIRNCRSGNALAWPPTLTDHSRSSEIPVDMPDEQTAARPRPRIRRLLQALLSPSKFALVGIIGIVVNQVALYALTDGLGIYYLFSAILASQLSTLNNFVLTELWVFRGREQHSHVLFRYVVFNLLNIATLVIRVPVLFILTDLFAVHYLISNLVAIGLTFGVRYAVADNWIWAGRDRWDQKRVKGWFNYDIQGIVRVRSRVGLPELAVFNVTHDVEPDLVIRRRRWLGGGGRRHVAVESNNNGAIRYREHFGRLSAAFDITPGEPIYLDANWMLTWSHHVLYTNMVEPLLRFMLVTRGHVLLHCAAIESPAGAVLLSAQTDTGKTSTVLRLLMRHSWKFIADDMAIVRPDGIVLSYPKPMTLSSHTMSAVNDHALPLADRMMLAVRSRLHSREGRAVGHALGRRNIPIVTLNSWVQILIPPPKYHVTSLVDCELANEARIDALVIMERGEPLAERAGEAFTTERLLENTDDAYTFPPFSEMAPKLVIDGQDYPTLRARERELLAQAVSHARRFRVRIEGYGWADAIPELLYPTTVPGPVSMTTEHAAMSSHEGNGRPVAAAPARTTSGVADSSH